MNFLIIQLIASNLAKPNPEIFFEIPSSEMLRERHGCLL